MLGKPLEVCRWVSTGVGRHSFILVVLVCCLSSLVVLGGFVSAEIPYSGDDVSDAWRCVRSVLLKGGCGW